MILVNNKKIRYFLRIGGHCNHVFGLLYTLNHWFMLKLTEIPADKTCTSLPQTWHVPRGPQIQPEPVMSCSFAVQTLIKRKREKDRLLLVNFMMPSQQHWELKGGREKLFSKCVLNLVTMRKNLLHLIYC